MKLIQHFEELLKGGVTLKITICAAGDNLRMDILPIGKDSKTGVSLPPRALVGTAAELDAGLDEFLPKYAASVKRISAVVADADAELEAVEKAAAEQARQAVAEKAKPKPAKQAGAKSQPVSASKRDPAKGMLDDGVDGETDDDQEGGDSGTTLDTSVSTQPTPPAAESGNALSADLF
jgi:PRTRC genetic system protein E